MDKNTRYQQSVDFKRLNGVQIEPDEKKKITSIAIAHYAAGNTSEFQLGMNALGKVETSNAIVNKLDQLEGQITELTRRDSEWWEIKYILMRGSLITASLLYIYILTLF